MYNPFFFSNFILCHSPRLKESVKQDAEKIKSLSLDLQRKEDDSSDLKEKLADYKKQVQQIQKEVHTIFFLNEKPKQVKKNIS